MKQLKQTLQTYIETLHATGASKDYDLACLMKQVEEMLNLNIQYRGIHDIQKHNIRRFYLRHRQLVA